MTYINPYDIAKAISFKNLSPENFFEFREVLLKKLERSKTIIIDDREISKEEIKRVLEELEDDVFLLNLYKRVDHIPIINEFLNGKSIKREDIKQIEKVLNLRKVRLVNFLEPYLLDRLSQEYEKAFFNQDINFLNIKFHLNGTQLKQIYNLVYKELLDRKLQLISLQEHIEFKPLEDNSYLIYTLYERVKTILGDIKVINSLPDYFLEIRRELAISIKNLANTVISIYEKRTLDLNHIDLASKLIDLALQIDIDYTLKQELLFDKDDIKRLRYTYKIENGFTRNPILWLDAKSMNIYNKKPKGLEYGIHINEDRTPMPGLVFTSGEIKNSPMKRPICSNHYIYPPDNSYLWKAPSMEEFIEVLTLFRRFIIEDREGKEEILINKVGFDKIGTQIKELRTGKYHDVYIYQYTSEPINLELLLYSNKRGRVTELNRYNSHKSEELKIPIDSDGVFYLFTQVYGDMNRVDFSKFNLTQQSFDDISLVNLLLDFNSPIPELDNLPIKVYPRFWKK